VLVLIHPRSPAPSLMSKPRTLVAILALSLSTASTAIGGWEQIHLFFRRTTAEATKPSRENDAPAGPTGRDPVQGPQHRRSKVLTSLSTNPEEALENTNFSSNFSGVKAVADAKAKGGAPTGTRGGTQFTSTPAFTRRGGTQFKTVLDEVRGFPWLSARWGLSLSLSLNCWCHSTLD